MAVAADMQPAARADPLIGHVVDHYRIERELGRGGMGVVYLARHEDEKLANSVAAVKTISPHALQDEKARSLFVREAEALGRVTVDGLVRILNVGQLDNGAPYILMEYLEGQDLRQRLHQAGRLSPELALSITRQVAITLAALHAKNVVHRDLKPDNIRLLTDPLIREGVRTKLLDLGIAKLLGEATATKTSVSGTPLYMAPESCAGEHVEVQADIYSLGCVLYEMLCGRPPYLVDGGDVMAKHVFQRPLPPHKHQRDLPRAVSEFVMELLAREPADRPMAKEVAERADVLGQGAARVAWRGRWLWRRFRQYRDGIRFAILVGMPLLLILLLVLFAADFLVRWLPPSPGVGRMLRHSSVVRIPAGTFTMGSTEAEIDVAWSLARTYDRALPKERQFYEKEYLDYRYLERERIQRAVELPSFLIDRYEVTNADFSRFLQEQLQAGVITVRDQCPNKSGSSESALGYPCVYKKDVKKDRPYKNLYNDPRYGGITFDNGRFVVAPELSERPVVAVSWEASADFCSRHNKRLPTEAEWEYVARRGNRRFPWGDRPPVCDDSVIERRSEGSASTCRREPTVPVLPNVGSTAADQTLDGVYDMGGSVAEWTSDWFVDPLPSSLEALKSPRNDRPAANASPFRALRGGAWTENFLSARGAARSRARPELLNASVGFRCVRDIK